MSLTFKRRIEIWRDIRHKEFWRLRRDRNERKEETGYLHWRCIRLIRLLSLASGRDHPD
jgi:hypothetical protein